MTTKTTVNAHDHVQGKADARITLIEYGDYECSYCGRAYPIVKELQKTLGADLRFVFRNFPLTDLHPHALHAAEVAEAAALQGAFWPMHDALYEHQKALSDEHLVGYARALQLDVERLVADANGPAVKAQIQRDLAEGQQGAIQGTPAFFINGHRHDGPWDLENLLAAIQRA